MTWTEWRSDLEMTVSLIAGHSWTVSVNGLRDVWVEYWRMGMDCWQAILYFDRMHRKMTWGIA